MVYTLDMSCEKDRPLQFTLRFKPGENSPWIWSKEQTATADGRIVFQTATALDKDTLDFDHLFENPDCAVAIKPVSSQVSGVDLFEVSAAVLAGTGNVVLGLPLLLENFYALVRLHLVDTSAIHC